MVRKRVLGIVVACALAPIEARAQTATNLPVLKGLAPVTVLSKTNAGRAALAANYSVTGGIQTGAIRQSTLLPFAEQQQQALRDAFITDGNLAELADGLGTTLGAAYQARAHYLDRERFTSIAKSVADLIAYANSTTGADSNAGKYFFANATTDGKKAVADEAMAILKANGGSLDAFGRAYGRPAGSPGADAYGDSRPFQTEPSILPIVGPDYFNVPADNVVYNRGPVMNLIDSPSYPSGHTTYGYMGSILLAVLLPERYQQMIVRASEYGNDRIIMGAHYAMDVLGGRTLATYDLAHLLANDPTYMARPLKDVAATTGMSEPQVPAAITDFRAALNAARADLTKALAASCGDTVQACAVQDIGRFGAPAMNEAFYAATQTYGLPVVYPEVAGKSEDVGQLAPEAGYLLTAAFPSLSLEQADRILTETEGPGGGFLDDGSPFGLYSRLNLYAAAGRAAAMTTGR
ncbi:phosphatase PAP2 family protein [Lichenifustis flavocetrariae]|uniref:Phosphatase PAP2 family protein n=1 Tax=Lichenifustis flavocetrariae TaxID=2949735 RepID=A0AA41YZL9_9HYPH|nr:phosphatase PAP2 family protein [Lichenifustis flavocetrariae]MCW6507765.1 phosphatase PAP2 family protein [Lichenifustis flavocetrariae]